MGTQDLHLGGLQPYALANLLNAEQVVIPTWRGRITAGHSPELEWKEKAERALVGSTWLSRQDPKRVQVALLAACGLWGRGSPSCL